MYRVRIKHRFEMAHRLSHPGSPRKCQSIHGHSFGVTVHISGENLDERGMLVEFGALKMAWRTFIDQHLDHHLAVREDDPVLPGLRSALPESRIITFPSDPTTEVLAQWLFQKGEEILEEILPGQSDVRIRRIEIQETPVNGGDFEKP